MYSSPYESGGQLSCENSVLGGRVVETRFSAVALSGARKSAVLFAQAVFFLCRTERVEAKLSVGNCEAGRGEVEAILAKLNEAGIRYVAIGGQAVRLHGLPRFSMDWDLWIPARDPVNFRRLNEAIGEWLGEAVVPMGSHGENFVQTFQTPFGIVQFHLAVPGMGSFESVEASAVELILEGGTPCRVLSLVDLLQTKQAAGRPQDQVDIEFLREKLQGAQAGTSSPPMNANGHE